MTKSQLDKLGNSLRAGLNRENLIALSAFRNEFIASTNTVAKRIVDAKKTFKVRISLRPAKSTGSIIAKLNRESIRLSQMQDIGGLRVVVSRISVQNKMVRLLARLYPEAKVIDRRSRSLSKFGYRAVHVVVEQDGRFIEVQVRTDLQNSWSQLSEKYADLYDPEIKYGGGPKAITDSLKYLSRYGFEVERDEAQLDEYKRNEINALRKKRRDSRLTKRERDRLALYERLKSGQGARKTAMIKYCNRAARA